MRRNKLLPGIASATKRRPDGSMQKYFYAWRGGPLLKGEDGSPLQPSNSAFVVAYSAAHAERKRPAVGTLFNLIAAFKTSTEFTTLSDSSKKAYRRYLQMIEDEFATMPLAVLQDRRARGKFKIWRDGMAAQPRKADYAWTTLARLLAVAKDRGTIAVNVCERGGRLYESDRADIIWRDEHINAFCAVASPELQFALLVALWTGQRQGDMIKMTWSQYDGSHIRLQVGKRRKGRAKKRVMIPIGATLKIALDARRPVKADGPILRNTFGEPWTGDGFRSSWGKAFDKSNLADSDLHFHDLRGTAVTRLALAGCTPIQIRAITGHTEAEVNNILEANYIGAQPELADQAIAKLVAQYGS